ncbi:hypothetical protein SKAU_G00033020 [Synaphobranchus kaupii]|uniref:HAP1 N-terminal domain-containing protein n=1 Tax=Synaphobranchus kaupii TaxID=118154 RepID=A0A9Q1GFG9_SYNKA|nr:hypothetical protein SKAU_G00033020 [Synaphobranchus kaupii]
MTSLQSSQCYLNRAEQSGIWRGAWDRAVTGFRKRWRSRRDTSLSPFEQEYRLLYRHSTIGYYKHRFTVDTLDVDVSYIWISLLHSPIVCCAEKGPPKLDAAASHPHASTSAPPPSGPRILQRAPDSALDADEEQFVSEAVSPKDIILRDAGTITDVCNSTDLPEVEIISLLEEQLPHYKLRADTIYGYDHDDWLHTPLISPDTNIDLTTEQIEETLKYFQSKTGMRPGVPFTVKELCCEPPHVRAKTDDANVG